MAAERETNSGRMPDRPFVLLGQQYLADPTRSAGNVHPLYAYAHVPHGYAGDATEAIIRQIERFAPGFREQIVATSSSGTADLAEDNPNQVGGDIIGGANTELQVVLRPRVAVDPYSTGGSRALTCARPRPRRVPEHMECAGTTQPNRL